MNGKRKKPQQTVTKPFLTGGVTDENTLKTALKLFGILLLIVAMTFIVCMMTHFENDILRIIVNLVIILLVLLILFNKGAGDGTEAVARGEILYQRKEKGAEMTENERRLSYHSMKGFLNGLLASVPLLIPAIVLAVITRRTITSIGTLPGWMDSLTRRSEIGDALITYTKPAGLSFTEVLRAVVRAMIMPWISMAGSGNKDLLLTIERISPLLLLLPAAAYGIGYTRGREARTRVHTNIAENNRIRKRRENKARMKRRNSGGNRGPEQLN